MTNPTNPTGEARTDSLLLTTDEIRQIREDVAVMNGGTASDDAVNRTLRYISDLRHENAPIELWTHGRIMIGYVPARGDIVLKTRPGTEPKHGTAAWNAKALDTMLTAIALVERYDECQQDPDLIQALIGDLDRTTTNWVLGSLVTLGSGLAGQLAEVTGAADTAEVLKLWRELTMRHHVGGDDEDAAA